MSHYVNLKETNVLIRKALKQAFPDQKFSVVGDSYAGGASTMVRWVGGPSVKAVEEVTRAFVGSSFDGMIDLKSYVEGVHPESGERVHFASDYVWTQRENSAEEVAAAAEVLAANGAEDKGYDSYPLPEALQQWFWRNDVNGLYEYGNYGHWLDVVVSTMVNKEVAA